MKTFIVITFLLVTITLDLFAQHPAPIQLASGKAIRYESYPSQYVTPRNIDVWLPDGYSEQNSYAVLYMHDGQMLFDANTTWNNQEWGADETVGEAITQGLIEPLIIVAIWNPGPERHADYFPQRPFEYLPKAYQDSLINQAKRNTTTPLFSKEIQSDAYLKFFVHELKPFIDNQYATLPQKEKTFIAGSSMGGLISLYAICEYPDTFGGAACMSTHWIGIFNEPNNPIPGAFQQYLENHLPDPSNHKIYFDYGTATLDSQYEPHQLKVDAIMKEKGYTSQNWKTLKFEGKDHSETAWRERFMIPLLFLLGQ